MYFYGISARLKAIIDRLHTPMRNEFRIKKLALLLVGAATLPELFDPIKLQYQLILNFFHLEDAGMILVRGVKDKGDIKKTEALKEAYTLGWHSKKFCVKANPIRQWVACSASGIWDFLLIAVLPWSEVLFTPTARITPQTSGAPQLRGNPRFRLLRKPPIA